MTSLHVKCSVEECAGYITPKSAKGFCPKHYGRFLSTGDPRKTPTGFERGLPTKERFYRIGWKVDTSTGCWNWARSKTVDSDGYAQMVAIIDGTKTARASRVSYFIHRGSIPKGLFVLHSCDNRLCVNPEHLRVGTPKENTQDAKDRNRFPRNEEHSNTVIPSSDVVEIKRLYATRLYTQKTLSLKFNCSKSQIGNITRGEQRR